jgi:cytoskeleton protein RodZ
MNDTSTGATSTGEQLRAAREAAGMGASDIADRLKVRPSIVTALETDRYADLPEPIYTRSYLERYAQIVGLDARALVRSYEQRAGYTAVTQAIPVKPSPKPRGGVPILGVVIGVLVAGGLGVAGWQWWQGRNAASTANRTPLEQAARAALNNPSPSNRPLNNTLDAPSQGDPASLLTVKLSVTSTPSGAAVLLDRFKIGVTPLKDAPVSGGRQRELRLERAGYTAFTQKLDLTQNRNLSVTLTPTPVTPPPAAAVAAAQDKTITLSFRGRSWLRITGADGRVLYEGIPEAGSTQRYTVPITVRAGRPDVIAVTSSTGTRDPLGGASAGTFRLP